MKTVVLFSKPSLRIIERLEDVVFPSELRRKVLGYIPSEADSIDINKFRTSWEVVAKKNESEFVFIDNSKRGRDANNEIRKLERCNILVLTGGNTFIYLKNLRESGLDEALVAFSKKKEFVISAFSAGAVILSPTIRVSAFEGLSYGTDNNQIELNNLKGLGIIDFEVIPHFNKEKDQDALDRYNISTTSKVVPLADDDFMVVNLP